MLRETVDLARHVEKLGYHRYWFAEHHGMEGIASAAPAVLVGHIAAATASLRVGSGGVMLPNHSPLAIAEQFGTLEALHPGRIDLGIGRAPGSDPLTAAVLRRSDNPYSEPELPRLLGELARGCFGTLGEKHRADDCHTGCPSVDDAAGIDLVDTSNPDDRDLDAIDDLLEGR